MTEGVSIRLLNDTLSDWTFDYKVGSGVHTLTLPTGTTRELVATHYSDASAWVPCPRPLTISARSGIAQQWPSDPSRPVVECLTVLMGLICAIAFWKQANPFRK